MTMKIKEYKIVREDYWDDGNIVSTDFRVMKRHRFLGWVYVKKEVFSWIDSYSSPITFKTQEDAEDFVERLMKGALVQGWTSTVVKVYEPS